MKSREKLLGSLSWLTAVISVTPGIVVWYTSPRGGISDTTGYGLFPLFGLIAFGLMWSHYIVAVLRMYLGVEKSVIKKFRTVTGWIVLVSIVLHPAILAYNLARDGFGLPPGSYLNHYVAPSLKWAALLGMFSLLVFLAYELHRWFESKKWWPYVQLLSDIAMLAIVVHSFKLGADLQAGWFRPVWFIYAATLVAAQMYIYYRKYKNRNMLG